MDQEQARQLALELGYQLEDGVEISNNQIDFLQREKERREASTADVVDNSNTGSVEPEVNVDASQTTVEAAPEFEFNLSNFNSQQHAQSYNFVDPETDDDHLSLYEDAVNRALGETKKRLTGSGSNRKAVEEIINSYERGRELLNVPDKSDEVATLQGLAEHLGNRELPQEVLDDKYEDYLGGYTSRFTKGDDAYFKYEHYRDLNGSNKALNDNLVSQADNDNFVGTVGELINKYNPSNVGESDEQLDEVEELNLEQSGFFTGLGKTVQEFGSEFVSSVKRANANEDGAEQLDQVIDDSKLGELTATSESIVGYGDRLRKIDSLGENEAITKIAQSKDIAAAFDNFLNSPGSVFNLLVEQYPNLGEELGLQLLGTGAGAVGGTLIAGPVGGVAGGLTGGAAASAPAIHSNTVRDYFQGQILNHLNANGLDYTDENVASFITSPEGQASLDKSETYADVITTASVAAGLFGGGVLTSTSTRLAGKLGLEIVEEGGKLAVKESVRKKLVDGSLALATDLTGEVAASASIGEQAEIGELFLEGIVGIAEVSGDVAAGSFGRNRSQATQNAINEINQPQSDNATTVDADQNQTNDATSSSVVRDSEGVYHSLDSESLISGASEQEVLDQLASASSNDSDSLNVVDEVTVSDVEDVLNLKIVSNDVAGDTQTLVDAHNSADNKFNIPSNTTVTKNSDDTYTAVSGARKEDGNSITQAVSKLNRTNSSAALKGAKLKTQRLTRTTPFVLPTAKNKSKFKSQESQQLLVDNGFKVIKTSARKGDTKNVATISAYKDGVYYTFTNSGKDGAVQKKTTAISVDSGEDLFRASSDTRRIQKLLDRDGNNASDFVVNEASLGINVIRRGEGDDQTTVIDTGSLGDFALRNNLTQVKNDPKFSILRDADGKLIKIAVLPDDDVNSQQGNIVIVEGNTLTNVSGEFGTSFTSQGALELSVVIDSFTSDDHTLVDVQPGKQVTLLTPSGKRVTIKKQGTQFVSNDDSTSAKLSELHTDAPIEIKQGQQQRQAIDDELEVDLQAERNTHRERVDRRVTQHVNDLDNDGLTQLSSGNYVSSGDTLDVELDATYQDKNQIISSLKLKSLAEPEITPAQKEVQDTESDLADRAPQTEQEIVSFRRGISEAINTLPQHIADSIEIHYDKNNTVTRQGALGLFQYKGNANGSKKIIHIDAGPGRTLNDVKRTISHEVAHFSFSSWNTPALTKLYDRVWQIVQKSDLRGLYPYIRDGRMDLNNLTDDQKALLVNEYLAEQGTTILNVTGKGLVGLPEGVTESDVENIKRDQSNVVTQIVLDLRGDLNKQTQQESHQFITDILNLQAGVARSGGVMLTYKLPNDINKRDSIIVRTTPWGTRTQVIHQGELAQQLVDRKARLSKANGAQRKFLTHWYDLIGSIAEPMLGRDLLLRLSKSQDNTNANVVSQLNKFKSMGIKLRSILNENGHIEDEVQGGYVNTFKQLGVAGKKQLELAESADQFLKAGEYLTFVTVGLIRTEYDQNINYIRSQAQSGLLSQEAANKIISELTISSRRFQTDWNHGMYNAYEADGLKELQQMQDLLNADDIKGGNDFPELARQAQKKIDEIQASDLTPSKKFAQISKLNSTVSVNKRLNALHQWATNTLPRNDRGPESINVVMLNKVTQIKELNKQHQQFWGSSKHKMQSIDTVLGRTLDPTDTHDQLLIEFLDPIVDPIQQVTNNIHQQQRVLSKLQSNRSVVQMFVETGKGRLIDDTQRNKREQFSRAIAEGQENSLLHYLEVDPTLAPYVADVLEVSGEVEHNLLSRLVGWAKGNFTIRNAITAISNYPSALSLDVQNGSMFYAKYQRDDVDFSSQDGTGGEINAFKLKASLVRQEWRKDALFTKHKEGSFSDVIYNELQSRGILGSGSSSFETDVAGRDALEFLVDGLSKGAVGRLGSRSDQRIESSRDFVRRIGDFQEKFYRYPDDYNKSSVYLMHRQVGMAKAIDVEISRDDFRSGELGDIQYQEAVVKYAGDYAENRVNALTFTWADTSKVVVGSRKGTGNLKVLRPDFLLHQSQYLKILVQTRKVIGEQKAELKKLRDDGLADSDYYKRLRRAQVAMRLGETIAFGAHLTSSGVTAAISGKSVGYTLSGVALYYLFSNDDEEGVPTEQREDMSVLEMEGANDLAALNTFPGMPAYAPVSRDGYKITMVNSGRLNMMNTFPQHPIHAVDADKTELATNYIEGLAGSFTAGTGASGTLFSKSVNTLVSDFDEYGREYPDDGIRGRVGRLVSEIGISRNLRYFNRFFEDTESSCMAVSSIKGVALNAVGMNALTCDSRDIITRQAYSLRNELDYRDGDLRALKDALNTNDDLGYPQLVTMLNNFKDKADIPHRRLVASIEAGYKFGLTRGEILTALTQSRIKQTKVLPKKMANSVMVGIEPSNHFLASQLESLVKGIKGAKGRSLTADQKQVRLSNLNKAIKVVNKAIADQEIRKPVNPR